MRSGARSGVKRAMYIIKFLCKHIPRQPPSPCVCARLLRHKYLICPSAIDTSRWRLFNYFSICTCSLLNWKAFPFRRKIRFLSSVDDVFTLELELCRRACVSPAVAAFVVLKVWWSSLELLPNSKENSSVNWKTFSLLLYHSVLIGFCLLVFFFSLFKKLFPFYKHKNHNKKI